MGTNLASTSSDTETAATTTTTTFRYGITSPISEAGPTEDDLKRTEALDKCLRQYKVYESDDELNSRMEVLRKINTLVKEWVKQVSLSKVGVLKRRNSNRSFVFYE